MNKFLLSTLTVLIIQGTWAQSWTGAVSSEWNNAQNWSATPNNGSNITINALNLTGAAQMPVISSNSSFNPGTITMSNGAILTINANLSTSGNVFVNDAGTVLNMNNGVFAVNFSGNGRLVADFGGQINMNAGTLNVGQRLIAGADATIIFNGGTTTTNERLLVDGSGKIYLNQGTVNVGETFALADGDINGNALFEQNGGVINITGEAGLECEFGNYQPTVRIKGGTFNLNGEFFWFGEAPGAGSPRLEVKGGVMNITGPVSNMLGSTVNMYFLVDSVGVVNMGNLLDMPFTGDSLVLGGNGQMRFDSNASINNLGTVYADGGTLEIVAASAQLNGTGFYQWHHVNISGTNASLVQNAAEIRIHGNFNKTGTFTSNSNLVVFNGLSEQILSGQNTASFFNLQMNGPGGLSLLIPAQINNNLTLTLGKINTSSAVKLHFLAGSNASQGSNLSFVNGPMTKAGNTAFVFPIGRNNKLGRLEIGTSSAPTNVFEAEFFDNSYTQISPLEAPLQAVSVAEYWSLNQTTGTGSVNVSLHWENAAASLISSCDNIGMAKWNGATWQYVLSTTSGLCTGTNSGSLNSISGISPNGIYSIGFTSGVTSQALTICESETVSVGNNTYNVNGVYIDTLLDNNNQDSIIFTSLTVNPTTYQNQTVSICEGDAYIIGNNTYFEPGIYIDTLLNEFSCLHILTTNLILNSTTFETQNITICSGESIAIGNNIYSTAGTYIDTLQNEFGCYHVLTTELSIYVVNEELNYLDGTIYSLNTTATSFQWFDCVHNQALIGATSSSYTPLDNSLYAVILVDNNCIDTTFCLAIFDVGFSENQISDFQLYPNPADALIHLSSISGMAFTYQITDNQGRIILQENVPQINHSVNISDFESAYYIVRLIATDGSVFVKPFIKN